MIIVQVHICLLKLKYQNLYNDNGQCYLLTPDGLQMTRDRMDQLHGHELSDAMFDFCRQCFTNAHVLFRYVRSFILYFFLFSSTESNVTYLLDATMVDANFPRMLRACYLYALYKQLCHRRDEIESKQLCARILKVS
jgi:hypothetical protein